MGCILTSVTTQEACAARGAGYSWQTKASTEQECNAHGSACQEAYDQTGLSSSDCATCGGVYGPIYKWRTGSALNGYALPLTWATRTWSSVNKWAPTLDYQKLQNALNTAISSIVGRKLMNELNTRFNGLLPLLELAACDCAGIAGANCFSAKQAPVATCRGDPGKKSDCAGVQTNENTFPANGKSGDIVVTKTLAGTLTSGETSSAIGPNIMGLMSNGHNVLAVGNSASYAIVKNSHGAVIGQLIGDGYSFTSTVANSGTFRLCLDQLSTIDQDTTSYPALDFATGVDASHVGLPLGLTVTQTGAQSCADITGPGNYFPILRKTNYQADYPPASSSTGVFPFDEASSLVPSIVSLVAIFVCVVLVL
jgi:hypothetical protein